MGYFEHRFPCDATLLGKFRSVLGEESVEELLSQIIRVAIDLKAISPRHYKCMVVDTHCVMTHSLQYHMTPPRTQYEAAGAGHLAAQDQGRKSLALKLVSTIPTKQVVMQRLNLLLSEARLKPLTP